MRIRFYAILLLIFQGACTSVFYQPHRETYTEPRAFGLDYAPFYFYSKDGTKLSGWHFPHAPGTTKKGAIVQFHGNAENMTTHFASLVWLVDHGYDLYAWDYRGYGKSDGEPTQEKINLDAHAMIDYAISNEPQSIVLYCQSLGGAICLRAAAEKSDGKSRLFRAIVVEGTFSSYQRVARRTLAKHWLTWIFQPLAWITVSDSTAPEDLLKNISPSPVLVIHGEQDPVVDIKNGKEVFDGLNVPKEFWPIPEGRHIDTYFIQKGAYKTEFLERLERL